MESCGTPTSTVRMPRLVARIGPIVLPQPMSLRTTKSCVGTFAAAAQSRNSVAVTAVVAYRWFALCFTTTPLCMRGWWLPSCLSM